MTEQEINSVQQDTQAWLEKAVIGLNLCPFAKSVHVNKRLRYVVSAAETPEELLKELARELLALQRADPNEIETTLLIHPRALQDFLDFNDFLGAAEALVEDLELDGELQIASFHPQYQFGGTAPDDISNCTNRSPYPTLHILRESSIAGAVEAMPDTDAIYENNMRTLETLGQAGWDALGLRKTWAA
ncbi:MAG: DUF1415 domain-containing protein [Burkholderiaceae bacterium]